MVQPDLVLAGGLELHGGDEQVAIAPEIGGGAVGDLVEGDQQSVVERARPLHMQLRRVWAEFAGNGTGKKARAGREDRVRRVGQELDYHLAADPVGPAHATHDRVRRSIG